MEMLFQNLNQLRIRMTENMPSPVSLRELVRRLRACGFQGPDWGGKHPFMMKDSLKLRIPNDHGVDIRASLLAEILRQAQISSQEWEDLR